MSAKNNKLHHTENQIFSTTTRFRRIFCKHYYPKLCHTQIRKAITWPHTVSQIIFSIALFMIVWIFDYSFLFVRVFFYFLNYYYYYYSSSLVNNIKVVINDAFTQNNDINVMYTCTNTNDASFSLKLTVCFLFSFSFFFSRLFGIIYLNSIQRI